MNSFVTVYNYSAKDGQYSNSWALINTASGEFEVVGRYAEGRHPEIRGRFDSLDEAKQFLDRRVEVAREAGYKESVEQRPAVEWLTPESRALRPTREDKEPSSDQRAVKNQPSRATDGQRETGKSQPTKAEPPQTAEREEPRRESPNSGPETSEAKAGGQGQQDARATGVRPSEEGAGNGGDKDGRDEHWSDQPYGSETFQEGIEKIMETIPGDSPLERRLNLYEVLPKKPGGGMTDRSRKLWDAAFEYEQERIQNYIRSETQSNVAEALSKPVAKVGRFVGSRVLKQLKKLDKRKKSKKKKKKKSDSKDRLAPTYELFIKAATRPGHDNHHIALKAVFERAKNPRIQELYYELQSVSLARQTHHALHRIVNNALKRENLFPNDRGLGSKAEFSGQDVRKALETLQQAYKDNGVRDFAYHIEGLINAMDAAGFFKG